MSTALKTKYGAGLINVLSQLSGHCLIKGQATLFNTKSFLPWKYVINVSTPGQKNELTLFLSNLLRHADDLGITSLAMPTIGTGQ